MREKFIKFMEGRYGVDAFARFTMGVAFVMIILSMFIGAESARRLIPLAFLRSFILITECFPEIYRSVMPKTRNICPLHPA